MDEQQKQLSAKLSELNASFSPEQKLQVLQDINALMEELNLAVESVIMKAKGK